MKHYDALDRGTVYPAVGTTSPSHAPYSPACSERRPDKSPSATNVPAYLAVCLLGLGSTLPTHALWLELPTLSRRLPEGRTLSLYLLIVLEAAHVAALAYVVAKRFARSRLSEVPFMYSCLALGVLSLVLLAAFWDHTTPILGRPNSFALLLSAFLAAIVSCVSLVTFIPFTARLRENYMTAVFLGHVLGTMVPQLLTVAQGLGSSLPCLATGGVVGDGGLVRDLPLAATIPPLTTNMTADMAAPLYPDSAEALRHSNPYLRSLPRTTPSPRDLRELHLRFSESTYFLVCGAVLMLSAACFVMLRWCSVCQHEYSDLLTDTAVIDTSPTHAELPAGHTDDCMEDDVWQCDGANYIQKVPISARTSPARGAHRTNISPARGTNRLSASPARGTHRPSASPIRIRVNSEESPIYQNCAAARANCLSPGRRVTERTSTTSAITSGCHDTGGDRPQWFPLLLFLTFWTTVVLSGPLAPDKAYACYPLGNSTFLIGALMADCVVVLSCVVAARSKNNPQVTIVIALSCLGTILLTYFVALMTFSHESESREESPLFGKNGEMLAAVAWTAVTALFSYARVSIAVVCRRSSPQAVLWYAYVSLLGAALGALSAVWDISVCKVFRLPKDTVCK